MTQPSIAPSPTGLWKELRVVAERVRQVWRLVSVARKRDLSLATLLMVLVSAGNTAVALLLGRLVDATQATLAHDAEGAATYYAAGSVLAAIAGIYLGREALNVFRRTLVSKSCIGINCDMQQKVVGHLLKVDLDQLAHERIGTLHGRIFRSVDGVVRFVRIMFLDCLPVFAMGLFALLAAVTQQPILGLIMLGVAPLTLFLTARQIRSQTGVRLTLMRDCEEIDGLVVEQLSGAEYIRVAHTVPLEIERLRAATERRSRREVRHHFAMSLYGCAKALNESFFHILVLGLAVYFAVNGQLSPGNLLTFSLLFLSIMAPLNEIHRVVDEGHEASLCVADLLAMLAIPIDRSFEKHNAPRRQATPRSAGVCVENLTHDYKARDGVRRRALDGVSLTIAAGETIGVAGRSGSGKTTLIKALLRTIHPRHGSIHIAGHPLAQLCREELAPLVGYVGQTPFLFSGTIRENIAYGNSAVDDRAIRRAAELAHLLEEIEAMPRAFDTLVTERGQNLSGGQRQRLALARILLKQAPLLILDEATSALDNISERRVQEALGLTAGERTSILIAHRLTTLKQCDRIFVFDRGQVVEEGSYDSLVSQEGLFAELVACGEQRTGPSANGWPNMPTESPAPARV